jgi:chromate reductase, NAD(P)H dehydrogenase (quinone)
MEVLGVIGSLRRDSHNGKLMRTAAAMLPPEIRFIEYAGLKNIPPFDEDDEPAPPAAVIEWRDAVTQADAVLFATPEYNGSIPGHLKNAVDWASRPAGSCSLQDKPVAVIGASMSNFGAVWAQAELRKVLVNSGAHVVDLELAVASAHDAFNDNHLVDREQTIALSGVLIELLHTAQQHSVA